MTVMVRRRIQQWLPSPEKVRSNRSLRFIAPLLERPWLWQLSRRRVAAGAAIGVFFGLLIPLLQIAVAAGAAILLRANLPVAAVATLVTNPFTFAPLYIAAYHTGAAVLGETPDAAATAALENEPDAESLARSLSKIGKPWFLGLVIFAVVGSATTWTVVNIAWIGAVRWQRWRAARRRMRPVATDRP
jgi:uncharacterized protein (DUF2062 family)